MKRRLNRIKNLELTAVNFYESGQQFGLAWEHLSEETQAAGRAAFKQLQASIFKPIAVSEAPKLLKLPAVSIAELKPLPTLRIACEQHGKRYSILGWRLSEFLELAEAASEIKAYGQAQSDREGIPPSGREVADNA
ncbi:hypothetical protein [Falsigemmobacter faecalis]|uniref:Uncharacterized protein n=1 Tax=Falsigemmobacter faecalis TaxID=2488730 RepID=A0A3P3DHJ7_9RHOB|nr:hypothetical protein [Falsigemmobacter faecalis]RRH72048.1 hypothetical protein EG244_15585 [Falsigemmobacter faecalis]